MAIDFTNVFNDYIIEPLTQIMSEEFIGIPIGFEEHSGHQSFLLNLQDDSLDDLRGRGQLRLYSIEVVYAYKKGGNFDKNAIKHVSNIAERFKRLVDNNRNFSVESHWIDESGTWGNTTTVWSADRDTYCWHSGRIESIDYEQEENEDNRVVKMLFECFREETI